MKFTPDYIETLPANGIFVFGANTLGIHKKGAAKMALDKFDAILGQPRGLQGRSYAIVTKDLKKGLRSIPLENILLEIETLYVFANENPQYEFYVTKIGCQLAGYAQIEIAKLFYSVEDKRPTNVIIPKLFHKESNLFNLKF